MKPAAFVLALLALLAAIYRPAVDGPPILDDLLTLQAGAEVAASPALILTRPRGLLEATIALDPTKRLNVLLHVAAALVLAWIVRRETDAETGAITALLWTVHPLQTESVGYLSQRAEVLSGLLVLVAFGCYLRAGSRWWLVGSVAATILATRAKERAFAVVLGLVLVHALLLGRRIAWSYLVALAGAVFLALWPILARHGDWTPIGAAGPYLASQPAAIGHYLQLTAWPADLCLDYGWPVTEARAIPLLATLAAGAVWLLIARRSRPVAFLLAAFAVALAPTSLFPRPDIAVEHRMYLALAPLAVLVALALGKLEPRTRWAVVALLVLALGVRSHARAAEYGDAVSIWQATVACAPDNWRARVNLASALLLAARYHEAVESAEAAMRLEPERWESHATLRLARYAVSPCGPGAR